MNPFAASPIRPFALSIFLFATTAFAQLPPDFKNAPDALGPDVPAFRVRPGYRVTRALPAQWPGAKRGGRFMCFSSDGKTLFISQGRREGAILALTNPDSNGVYQTSKVFVKGDRSAQGMAFRDGWLYFQDPQEGSVSRARDNDGDGVAEEIQIVLPKRTLPTPGGHPFNALMLTDKQMYVSASDAQNFTEDLDSPNKKIYVFDFDSKTFDPKNPDAVVKTKKVFVSGVRNNEKLQFRPGTTEIWGFDHGSDNYGKAYGETTGKNQPITDLNPPEELNHYVQDGFYGHPYLTGNRVPRTEFANRPDLVDLANKTIVPEFCVHAHWAVCGFTFLNTDYFPGHKGDLVFASHGSWNSVASPVGSCVQLVTFDPITGHPSGSYTIVDCAGPDRRYARPVDLTEAPDGSLLFTSDEPPALYRITRTDTTTTAAK